MPPTPVPAPSDADLAALCALFARRRAEVLAAALGGSAGPDAADRAWVSDAADSLRRLARHAGVAVRLGDDPDAVRAALPAVRDALVRDVTDPPARLPLAAAVGAALGDAALAARERGVEVAVDVQVPEGLDVPREAAGPLIDALGRVMRDAVVFGTPTGGAIRVVAHTEDGLLVVVVGDRGRTAGAAEASATLDARRVAGLRAAEGCIAAAGGDLTHGVGAWGGVSVTVRVPLVTAERGVRRPS